MVESRYSETINLLPPVDYEAYYANMSWMEKMLWAMTTIIGSIAIFYLLFGGIRPY